LVGGIPAAILRPEGGGVVRQSRLKALLPQWWHGPVGAASAAIDLDDGAAPGAMTVRQ
jgi:hypothetical protein